MFQVENVTTGEIKEFETFGAALMFATSFYDDDEFYIDGVRYELNADGWYDMPSEKY